MSITRALNTRGRRTAAGLLSVVAACGVVLALAQSASAGVIVSPVSDSVRPGSVFEVGIVVTGVTDLYAFQFNLELDPATLVIRSVSEGPFLRPAGGTVFIPGVINTAAGSVIGTAGTLTGSVPGNSGEGELASFQFGARVSGVSPLILSDVVLLDSALNEISSTTAAGEIVVLPATVPEPGSFGLVVLSGMGLAVRLWRRRSTA